MKRTWKFVRGTLIVLITVILTTIAINATDNIGNLSNSFLGSVIGISSESKCPENMAFVPTDSGGFCIDMYENSPSEDCVFKNPKNQAETRTNMEDISCFGISEKNATPWRNIARHQAELSCRNAGKRLPANKEWYLASLGTPDAKGNVDRNDCNVKSSAISLSGSNERCVSAVGAYDMVGNAWEWVDETLDRGMLNGKELPDEGYVGGIDSSGIPIETNFETPDQNFNEDYLWIEKEGIRGIIRGGYYGNGTDGGQYALNAITPPSFVGVGVGFRCVI